MSRTLDPALFRLLGSKEKSTPRHYVFILFALQALLLITIPSTPRAQIIVAPSQVTPQSLRPAQPNESGALPAVGAAAGLAAPAGTENI